MKLRVSGPVLSLIPDRKREGIRRDTKREREGGGGLESRLYNNIMRVSLCMVLSDTKIFIDIMHLLTHSATYHRAP